MYSCIAKNIEIVHLYILVIMLPSLHFLLLGIFDFYGENQNII